MSEQVENHQPNPENTRADSKRFRDIVDRYELAEESPWARMEAFKERSDEEIALFLADINRSLQHEEESQYAEGMVRVGDSDTVAVEHRYDTFTAIMEELRGAPKNISPARFGDALSLGVVLLHPFKEGNGRTARMLGYMFRDWYDDKLEYAEDFPFYAGSRDEKRAAGIGMKPVGYIPVLPEGRERSDPQAVVEYIHELLHSDKRVRPYIGTYGEVPRTVE